MEAKAPQSDISLGSVCCEDGGGQSGAREGLAAVGEEGRGIAAHAMHVMAERRELVVDVTAALGGDQLVMDTVATRGRRTRLHSSSSLPPSPLRGRWDRAGAQYEEARKLRMMQVLAARVPAENGLMRAPSSAMRHVTGIAAPTRAPSSAPVAHRLARLASYQWRNAVDNSIVAKAEMEKTKSSNEN